MRDLQMKMPGIFVTRPGQFWITFPNGFSVISDNSQDRIKPAVMGFLSDTIEVTILKDGFDGRPPEYEFYDGRVPLGGAIITPSTTFFPLGSHSDFITADAFAALLSGLARLSSDATLIEAGVALGYRPAASSQSRVPVSSFLKITA